MTCKRKAPDLHQKDKASGIAELWIMYSLASDLFLQMFLSSFSNSRCAVSVIGSCAVYVFLLFLKALWLWFLLLICKTHNPKENTCLHLGKWQWCQISTASSCQAPLYSKLKYDSPINTSLSWSFSPTALFQTSFEVCLPPLAAWCLCVWREKILSAQSNYPVLSNPAGD